MEPAVHSTRTDAAAPTLATPPLTVSGTLRQARAGWTRTIEIITGLVLLRWVCRGLVRLLGFRHEVTLWLEKAAINMQGERRLLGLPLGSSRRVIPLSKVRSAGLVACSSSWALLAGAGLIVACAAVAGVLILWGWRGRQPSWLGLAVLVLGLGVLLDACAYLLVRRNMRRARGTLEVRTQTGRFCVVGVAQQPASRLLDQLVGALPSRGTNAEQT